MNKTKMTDADLTAMNDQGWSPAELAIHFDCCPVTVERHLRRLGLDCHEGKVMKAGDKGGGRRLW
jgi:hypothetical protein